MTGAERYRKAQRLRSDRIVKILASSRPRRAGVVSVQLESNGFNYSRLGLIVPKRFLRRAVDRNRAKRMLREWFRTNQGRLNGQDVLLRLSARPSQLKSLIADLERAFASVR